MAAAKSGSVIRPSTSCTHRMTRIARSVRWLVRRMRGSKMRRCSSSVRPTKQIDAGDAAGDDGQHLLLRRADEGLVHPVRRQQAEQVAEEQEQDADVEQVAAPAQLAGAQQLRRIALPGVLVAVEARQAAHQEDGQADVRVDVEEEVVQVVHEGVHARGSVAAVGGRLRLRTIWIGCGWPGRAWPAVEQPSKAARLGPALVDAAHRRAALTACAFSPARSSSAASTLA